MNEIAPIKSLILEIRGQRVMLDRDLAMLYGVETKRLNEAVKRNANRFEGDDFMFRLTKDEALLAASMFHKTALDNSPILVTADNNPLLRSQFATSNNGRGGARYLPYAFTALGVAMLSSVLNSETAISINREIMRTFVQLSQLIKAPIPDSDSELRRDIEALRQEMNDILADQNDINEETRAQLDAISQTLAEMQAQQKTSKQKTPRKIGFV